MRTWILIAFVALGLAQANNTEEKVRLQVTLYTGEVLEGTVEFKSNYLEIRTPRKKKIKYPTIESLAEVPPPSEEDLAKLRETYARKLERSGELPKDWVRLGVWAADKGLEEEARQAFEKALELDPDFADAHERLGRIQVDGEWLDAATVLQTERRELGAAKNADLLALARRAEKHGAPAVARSFICEALVQDPWDKDGIKLVRKYTEAYRQSTQPLQFPLRGRWRASPDQSRHHQLKGYALYALDLMEVDAEGKLCKGDGKTLEDYYCWGKPIYAVAAGTVVQVQEGFPDNQIGDVPQGAIEKHNGISILHENREMSWYIHTKLGSITVKEGDKVEAGQLLAEVGNSGNSARPHLHFTLATWGMTSVPWHCDDYKIVAPDGTRIRVSRAFPREGWVIEHTPEGTK
ncbi:MAG: peptidoglycan DD-metalloendopeptidase family protein [Planctomycetota bacterium]